MFCPKCATQNIEGASYCRACGANISLVPQALTGQLPVANQQDDRDWRWPRRPSRERAVRNLTLGVAVAAIIAMSSKFASGSGRWWFWLLIPAMIFFSRGFAELSRLHGPRDHVPIGPRTELNSTRPPDLPAAKTGELRPVAPSVTEGTTRHLQGEARTRQL